MTLSMGNGARDSEGEPRWWEQQEPGAGAPDAPGALPDQPPQQPESTVEDLAAFDAAFRK